MWSYFYASFALCIVIASDSAAVPSETISGDEIVKRFASDERRLVAALEDKSLWKEAGPRFALGKPKPREAELLGYLTAARRMRSKAVIPVLLDKIAFNLYEGIAGKKKIPTDIKYPAYATLKAIGLPAIPALLEYLKLNDPLDEKERRDPKTPEAKKRQYGMAWMCIADIYAEKKFFRWGIPLAQLRIRAEIEDIRKKTAVRNSLAERRLERVITIMQKTEEFFDKD